MCGRYTLAATDPSQIRARWPVGERLEVRRRFNVAPGDDVLAVLRRPEREAEGALLRWGLVPSRRSTPAPKASPSVRPTATRSRAGAA